MCFLLTRVSVFVFKVRFYVYNAFFECGCQNQYNQLPEKICPRNDLLWGRI